LATEPMGRTVSAATPASWPPSVDTRSKLPTPGTGMTGAAPGARVKLAGRFSLRTGGGGVLLSVTAP
jgi:hypothetical protein